MKAKIILTIVAALVVVAAAAAHFFRYERLESKDMVVLMWDRWTQEPCIVYPSSPGCETATQRKQRWAAEERKRAAAAKSDSFLQAARAADPLADYTPDWRRRDSLRKAQ